MSQELKLIVPDEKIIRRITLLRGEKVILDVHLAELYHVETRALKQAVKRNIERFPKDFMFEVNDMEIDQMVSQFVIPSKQHLGGAKPFAFTEAGVAMLSSVLKSKRAVEVNIGIVRTFIALRKMALNYKEVIQRLEEMESKYEGKFKEIFKLLNYLIDPPVKNRQEIGFKRKGEK
ncbi:MAG: ORF6N domain-containing protein [Cyclobacteriaceae bacterium]|jgi:ORF6N domain|nr:ORF6N domain-containing protein [Flammeovirgaceae bacterium]